MKLIDQLVDSHFNKNWKDGKRVAFSDNGQTVIAYLGWTNPASKSNYTHSFEIMEDDETEACEIRLDDDAPKVVIEGAIAMIEKLLMPDD